MSLFSTLIPVDVQALVDKLPDRAFVHSVRLDLDAKGVLVVWDCDTWQTPYSVPVAVTPGMLEGRETLPERVSGCRRVQNASVAAGKGKAVKGR
jgi:hypothetical protein